VYSSDNVDNVLHILRQSAVAVHFPASERGSPLCKNRAPQGMSRGARKSTRNREGWQRVSFAPAEVRQVPLVSQRGRCIKPIDRRRLAQDHGVSAGNRLRCLRARAPGVQQEPEIAAADDAIVVDVVLRFGRVPGAQEQA
jgi:hypothetical protein